MKYQYTELSSNFPQRTYRSKRTKKKMHLGEFQTFLYEIVIPVRANIFVNDENDFIYNCLNDSSVTLETYSESGRGLHVLCTLPEVNKETIERYIETLLYKISEKIEEFASINEAISITYGDAYYGEW